jgi:hypothetical protein
MSATKLVVGVIVILWLVKWGGLALILNWLTGNPLGIHTVFALN